MGINNKIIKKEFQGSKIIVINKKYRNFRTLLIVILRFSDTSFLNNIIINL